MPATLWVGSAVGSPAGVVVTMFCVNCRAVRGVTTDSTPGTSPSSCSISSICRRLRSVKRSTTVLPSSIVKSVSMACPPKSSWYSTLSMYTWSSRLR